jgi:hypothetical protein
MVEEFHKGKFTTSRTVYNLHSALELMLCTIIYRMNLVIESIIGRLA